MENKNEMYDNFLMIDVEKHYPLIVRIFPGIDYYSPKVPDGQIPSIQPGLMSITEAQETYGFKMYDEESDLKKDYDTIFVMWPVNSLGNWLDARIGNVLAPTTHEKLTDMPGRRKLVSDIYNLINKLNPRRVVFFDGNDAPGTKQGLAWLDSQGFRYDAVFKREYRRTYTYQYSDSVHPYPFQTFGFPNPPWLLFENRVKGNKLEMGCFWSGAPIHRFQVERPDEWCNRRDILKEIHPWLIIKGGLPKEEFLQQFNTYKFFLHLNGTGHLCGRFFEGLSRDSLMIMQQMDTMFPFENDDGFSEECVFVTPREFVEKLHALATDDDLYEKCKNNQEYILSKYYNYDFLRKYILGKINDDKV